MSLLPRRLRDLASRLSLALLGAGVLGRVVATWRRRSAAVTERRRSERSVLPSIHDRYPGTASLPRRRVGLRSVPLDRIVGTMRHPSQNTADFLPLPRLRGENWRARWQRINRAMDRLVTLPPVDLVLVGDEYWVTDGHNRVAAARQAGGIEIDADVTQLVLPGVTRPGQGRLDRSSMVGAEEMRLAGQGRHTRTVSPRPAEDQVMRRDLARETDEERE
ncbi:MAG TPA: hypothetical protein VLA76_05200 [Candidatus Angelobacter sp.]|nr:hypothetical protein [Candidatus Angelobacter sp.]